jgi:4-hydroxy-tetrahydrodipicolinate synthase
MISMEERQKIIMTAVETVKGSNFPIIVGAGTINTNEVIKLSQQAESLGADGILAITPYYVKPPQRALVTHFNAIADSISIPVILYNCPGRTGVGMTVETVAQCSKNKNIIGLKDAVGDAVERIKPIKELCGDGFLLYRSVLGANASTLPSQSDARLRLIIDSVAVKMILVVAMCSKVVTV